ncbi:YchJ family protein [Actinacidiphila sp. bgisy144]|uniref:YchJ family protein n=1 Tax=unclassified Actinacidiphila TaxID=2995708 RepID=UPI003EBC25B8
MPRRPARTARPTAPRAGRDTPAATAACPCGLAARYGECCGALHAGAPAPTAERLMRSRYAAFAVGDTAYLLRTWAAATRPPDLDLDPAVRWTGLDILGSTGGSAFHTEGTVEFRARYRLDGRDGEQRENSRFVREGGRWVYVDALA